MRQLRLVTALSLALGTTAWAAMEMNLAKLTGFIQSSVKMKHPDKEVAAMVRQIKLTERLDDRTIEDFQGMGAGPKTLEALRALSASAGSLPPPAPAVRKAVLPPAPPPDALEQGKLIDEARDYALNYTKNLPNYICMQVTRRAYDQNGVGGDNFRVYDIVTARLSYDGQKEDYKIIRVNDRPVDMSMERLGGAKSSGDFATFMREIFEPSSHAHFEWERWATLRGHRQYVFSYAVEQQYSKWTVQYEKTMSVMPAYRGLIFMDKDTHLITRLTMEAAMPQGFPVSVARETLDYDYVKINESEFLLPLKAQVDMRTGHVLTRNEIEFRSYRRFGADTSITFADMDTPAPLPDDKTKEQPAK